MISVLHVTENPIAGAPMNLSNALNKWQGDKIHSRHVASSDRNENRIFKSDLLTNVHSFDEVSRAFLEADILHFHNFYSKCEVFRRWPGLWSIALKKKRIWQVHSPREVNWMDLEEGFRDRFATHLVIGQYHPRQWPEIKHIVPNIIDITEPELMPVARKWDAPLRVAYSPSRIRLPGWDDKGYDQILPTLQKLVNEGLITAEVIFNKPHKECLATRGKAHISIDEIVTGSYHLVSLESLSQGLCTIAGLDELQVKTLKILTNGDMHPWFLARPNNFEEKLRWLAESPAIVQRYAHDSRQWMEKFWHPAKTTAKFVDIYERC
jgi:hypothetical protein